MKPNFALDLTFDGIALLHRAGEAGWHVVGEVALDSPSLSDDLAALRKKANTLDPAGMRTKLIIPDEQIRYLDIPEASAPHGDHDAAAADALDGATPYALDDLAYDWTVSGKRLHIAAVARETLEEAESFAIEHGFNPICFVADPDQTIYEGEPFFGMTENAETSGTVERDTGPLKRLGALPVAGTDEAVADEPGTGTLSFSSVRAERGMPPRTAPRLEGVARITPTPLPDADARAISGAAHASLAPRDDAPPLGPAADTGPTDTTEAPGPDRATTEPRAVSQRPADEAERLTIFGARGTRDARRRKPGFLGLILTATLLIALIGVATWAAIFPESGLGKLLRGAEPQIAVTPDIPELESTGSQPSTDTAEIEPAGPADPGLDAPEPTPAAREPDREPDVAALSAPEEPAETGGATGAAEDPGAENAAGGWTAPRTPEEARARYAATGIWPSAPEAPDEPRSGSLDTFYQTSIDEEVNLGDAVALPQARALAPDLVPPSPALPPPPGRTFELDARGFVRATPGGALTPEGVRVHAGPPPVLPPETPPRAVPLPGLTPTGEAAKARESLSGIRPRQRPETLVDEQERGALGGRTRTELATLRPRTRPAGTITRADAKAVAAAVAEATDEAVTESLKPRLRPTAIAREAAPRRAAAAGPAIPTSASVAQRATVRNAINLRQVNLIGVYGTPSNRRALVRLSNGRYRKVQVGDQIDGGRVLAIGDTELRYSKSGRNVVLRLPQG